MERIIKPPVDRLSDDLHEWKKQLRIRYGGIEPCEWGETVTGSKTRLATREPAIALTLDACGQGGLSNGYDNRLIDYLRAQHIPATLFVTGQWMEANPHSFLELAGEPLFDIQNHGLRHKPCSVNGRSAFGIQGTGSIEEVIEEVEGNARKIEQWTGLKPRYYRSGTAYCDEIAVKIVQALGYEAVGFSVLGDKGATYRKDEVTQALLSAEPGSIAILHMNHPEGDTASGVMEAVPILLKRGFRFIKISDYPLL